MQVHTQSVNQQLLALTRKRACTGVFLGLERPAGESWHWSSAAAGSVRAEYFNWRTVDKHPLEYSDFVTFTAGEGLWVSSYGEVD
jgi:hypothetical protein